MNTLFFVVCVFFIASCGSSQSISVLAGNWETACLGAEKKTVYFDDKSGGTLGRTVYTSNCQTALFAIHRLFTHEMGDGVASPADAYKLDLAQTQYYIYPINSAGADQLNVSQYCGISGWEAGHIQNIDGRTCNGEVIPANGSRLFTIYKLNASLAPQQLSLGKAVGTMDGTSEAKRHDQLDADVMLKLTKTVTPL